MLTERHGAIYRDVVRRMGRDGWLGVGWPTEYGGRGLGQVEQQIFVNEAARADIPLPAVTLQTVGPTLQAHGTPEQKDFFLPRILAGEVHFAIGYTEPEAGTDLAALRTTGGAGDGTRTTWSTGRRSSPPAATTPTTSGWPAAPTRTPPGTGASRSSSSTPPIPASPGRRSSPPTARTTSTPPTTPTCGCRSACGSARRTPGWRLITTQLNHERVMLGPAGRLGRPARPGADWAAAGPGRTGAPLLDAARRAAGAGRSYAACGSTSC